MNPVPISCICPGKPHDGDTVTLKDPLGFREATTVRQVMESIQRAAKDIDGGMTVDEWSAALVETYVLYCIESWSVVDAEGKPVPVSKSTVRQYLLADLEAATEVGEEADTLYTPTVILPLLPGASTSSASSSTGTSTSATNGTGTTPRTPLKPSSTSSTQTAGTAVMTA